MMAKGDGAVIQAVVDADAISKLVALFVTYADEHSVQAQAAHTLGCLFGRCFVVYSKCWYEWQWVLSIGLYTNCC